MKFQFENLPDFIAMDGHGFYVWSAVIVAAFISAWLIISPLIRLRQVIKDIAQEVAIENIHKSEGEGSK
ncbi:MAG: heme exporter protein CcmD [SAR92 bacterium MED-G29]|nr:MAG: heme exporter protein CcmD [SAR92 bacterium MED-G29]